MVWDEEWKTKSSKIDFCLFFGGWAMSKDARGHFSLYADPLLLRMSIFSSFCSLFFEFAGMRKKNCYRPHWTEGFHSRFTQEVKTIFWKNHDNLPFLKPCICLEFNEHPKLIRFGLKTDNISKLPSTIKTGFQFLNPNSQCCCFVCLWFVAFLFVFLLKIFSVYFKNIWSSIKTKHIFRKAGSFKECNGCAFGFF